MTFYIIYFLNLHFIVISVRKIGTKNRAMLKIKIHYIIGIVLQSAQWLIGSEFYGFGRGPRFDSRLMFGRLQFPDLVEPVRGDGVARHAVTRISEKGNTHALHTHKSSQKNTKTEEKAKVVAAVWGTPSPAYLRGGIQHAYVTHNSSQKKTEEKAKFVAAGWGI